MKPFEYRSVFSPTDVIEEYTRPARIRENGRTVVKPALSEVEEVDVPVVGTLEAFNSDGLRTLLVTSKAANVCEKTLRYPGHAALMRAFRDAGFFGDAPVEAGGVRVVPRALTEKLVFASWNRPPEEEEFTVLSVTCRGTRRGRTEVRTLRPLRPDGPEDRRDVDGADDRASPACSPPRCCPTGPGAGPASTRRRSSGGSRPSGTGCSPASRRAASSFTESASRRTVEGGCGTRWERGSREGSGRASA